MTVGRRQFLRAGVAAAAVAAASGPAVLRAQGKGKVRFAYLQLGWAGPEIVHKEDLLGRHGWQAEYSVVPGSPVPLLNQLTSRNVDAIDMSFALAAKAFEDGAPVKVTGVATAVLGAIVARKDAGLTKVEDLKGRKVAAVVGTSTFFDVRALTLKGYGFDIQKDVQIVTATYRHGQAALGHVRVESAVENGTTRSAAEVGAPEYHISRANHVSSTSSGPSDSRDRRRTTSSAPFAGQQLLHRFPCSSSIFH
jgi:ABC-type nitrate/sulfonate/bicarbonate transport system substrate-binding protein